MDGAEIEARKEEDLRTELLPTLYSEKEEIKLGGSFLSTPAVFLSFLHLLEVKLKCRPGKRGRDARLLLPSIASKTLSLSISNWISTGRSNYAK